MPASPSRRALVTGGTGIVGRRVVRRLLGSGWDVAVMTRQTSPPPIDGATFIYGDLGDARTLGAAVEKRGLVVHCALSTSGVDARAAGDLADAAIAASVRRFVHVSTMSVYEVAPAGTLDESWAYVPASSRDAYALTKVQIEQTLMTRSDRLHLGILQPTNVLSDDGGWWTSGLVALMRKARLILVDGGAGTANLVGVDDVAAAAELAAAADYAPGSRFLIGDGHPVPWAGYLRHLERLAGGNALAEMTADEAKRYSRAIAAESFAARAIRRTARALTGARAVLPMDDVAIDRFASRTIVSIERATAVLGYSPSPAPWPASVP